MEKLIRPLIEKLNKKKTNEIFKKLPTDKIRQDIDKIFHSKFKDQFKGANFAFVRNYISSKLFLFNRLFRNT